MAEEGIVRDFSAEMLEWLLGCLSDKGMEKPTHEPPELQTAYGRQWADETECVVTDAINTLHKIFDINKAAAGAMTAIWEKVYEIDARYETMFEALRERFAGYMTAVAEIADMIDVNRLREGGGLMDGADFTLRAARLKADMQARKERYERVCMENGMAAQYAERVKKALEQYVDPTTGAYKWDAIAAALQADPKGVSPAEMTALCMAYLSMESPGDINRFIAVGYKRDSATADGQGMYGTLTPVFRSVAANTEAMVVAAVQYDAEPAKYEGLLRKAQAIAYIAAEVPTAELYFSTENGQTGTLAEGSNIFVRVGKDADGNDVLELLHSGTPIEFDLTQRYIEDEHIDRAEAFVESRQQSDGGVLSSTLSGTFLSVGIGVIVTVTNAPGAVVVGGIKLFHVLSTGIGVGIGLYRGYSSGDQCEKDSSRFLNDLYALQAVQLLGGKTYVITGPDGRQTLFGTTYRTTENAINTYGFVNSDLNTYGVTKDELEGIALSRGNDPDCRLTPEQQAKVLETYSEDWLGDDGPGNYLVALDDYLEAHPDLSAAPVGSNGTKDIGDCTYEELQKIIAEYNNSLK